MRTLRWHVWLCGLVLGAGGLCFAQEAKAPFTISKETTFFTEPVRADGTIDYVEALNARLSPGVTRQNNAAIPLLEAVSAVPDPRLVGHYNKVRAKLGLPLLEEPKADVEPAANFNGPEPANYGLAQQGPWTAEKAPEVAKWLKTLEPRLNQVVEASRRDRFYMPMVRERERDYMVLVLLPHLGEGRKLALALKARALLELGNEDVEAFRRDAVAVVRLGRMMTRAGTMIEWFVGANIEGQGLEAIRIAASGGWLSAEHVKQISADLRAVPDGLPLYDVFDLAERLFPLETLQGCAAHGMAELPRAMEGTQITLPPSADDAAKDWDAAMRKVNTWYDRMSAARRRPTFAGRLAAANELEADVAALKAKGKGKGTAVALEDRLMAEVMSSLSRSAVVETRLVVDRELTEVALALSAFRAASGEYPGDLAELKPAYLKAIPVDLFTEKALAYRPEGGGYVLKSFGPNGRDDAGVVAPANDDRVVRAER